MAEGKMKVRALVSMSVSMEVGNFEVSHDLPYIRRTAENEAMNLLRRLLDRSPVKPMGITLTRIVVDMDDGKGKRDE